MKLPDLEYGRQRSGYLKVVFLVHYFSYNMLNNFLIMFEVEAH